MRADSNQPPPLSGLGETGGVAAWGTAAPAALRPARHACPNAYVLATGTKQIREAASSPGIDDATFRTARVAQAAAFSPEPGTPPDDAPGLYTRAVRTPLPGLSLAASARAAVNRLRLAPWQVVVAPTAHAGAAGVEGA